MKPKTMLAMGVTVALAATSSIGLFNERLEAQRITQSVEAEPSTDSMAQSDSPDELIIGDLLHLPLAEIDSHAKADQTTEATEDHDFRHRFVVSKSIKNTKISDPLKADPAPLPKPISKRVYIDGDSLMQGAKEGLSSRLAQLGYGDIMIRAACGRPLLGGTTYESCDPGRPDELTGFYRVLQPEDKAFIAEATDVILGLGTNDFYQSASEFASVATRLINIIHQINAKAQVFWVNVYLEGKGENYKEINKAIAASGAILIDYASGAETSYSCADGVHPCSYEHMVDKIIAEMMEEQTDPHHKALVGAPK